MTPFDRVRQMIVERFRVAESVVTRDTSFADQLGADAVDVLEMIFDAEVDFDIAIADDAEINTVGDLVDAIDAGTPAVLPARASA